MKLRILLIGILLVFAISITAVFAEGQKVKSEVTITGTVESVSPSPTDGKITVTLSTSDKNYTLTLPNKVADALNLQEGKKITVKGTVKNKGDQSNIELKVQKVEKDGIEYEVKEGKDVNKNNDVNNEHESGKSEKNGSEHEGSGGSSGGNQGSGGNNN